MKLLDMEKLLYLKSVVERNDSEKFKLPKERAAQMNIDLRIIFLSNENKNNTLVKHGWGEKEFSFYYTLSILEREMEDYKPNYIALHTGVSFMFHPIDILQALAVIKMKYPMAKLVYEPKSEFSNHPRDYFMRTMHSSDYKESKLALEFLLLGENEIFEYNQQIVDILWK